MKDDGYDRLSLSLGYPNFLWDPIRGRCVVTPQKYKDVATVNRIDNRLIEVRPGVNG